jgi:hypothetical protein
MEETTSTIPVASKPKRKGRIRKWLARGAASVLALALSAQVIYTYSGSNQWEKAGERRGVVLYAMKEPGSNVKKFKAVWKVKTTLSRFVKFALEEQGEEMGMYDFKDLEKQNERVLWSTWKERYPSPFWPREYVVKNDFEQDPQTKALRYTVTAAADKLPPNDCCVRVADMMNLWTVTPLPGGEAQVEWLVDMDMGGYIPYFMQNEVQVRGILYFATRVQRFLDQKKYENAKYEWVDEGQSKP